MQTKPAPYKDGFFAFEAGMNAGVAPILLPKNQLANAINLTLRGEFCENRPAFIAIDLIITDQATSDIFTNSSLFQCAAVYQFDTGNSAILVQISGQLYLITPNVIDADVVNVPIQENDGTIGLNNPPARQAWMWQAEKWMIVQTGNAAFPPVFFDGFKARRSNSSQGVIGQVVFANQFTVPAVNATVQITLTGPYPTSDNYYGVPILIGQNQYKVQRVSASGGFGITLANINATPGKNIPNLTPLTLEPGNYGSTRLDFQIPEIRVGLNSVNVDDVVGTQHHGGELIVPFNVVAKVATAIGSPYPTTVQLQISLHLAATLKPPFSGMDSFSCIVVDGSNQNRYQITLSGTSQAGATVFQGTWLSAIPTNTYIPPTGSALIVILGNISSITYPPVVRPKESITLKNPIPAGFIGQPVTVTAAGAQITLDASQNSSQLTYLGTWQNPAFDGVKHVPSGGYLTQSLGTVGPGSIYPNPPPGFLILVLSASPPYALFANYNQFTVIINGNYGTAVSQGVPTPGQVQFQVRWNDPGVAMSQPPVNPGDQVTLVIGQAASISTTQSATPGPFALLLQQAMPQPYVNLASITAVISGNILTLKPSPAIPDGKHFDATWQDGSQTRVVSAGSELQISVGSVAAGSTYPQGQVPKVTIQLQAALPPDFANKQNDFFIARATGTITDKITFDAAPAGTTALTGTWQSSHTSGVPDQAKPYYPPTDANITIFASPPATLATVLGAPGDIAFTAPAVGGSVNVPTVNPFPSNYTSPNILIGVARYKIGSGSSTQAEITITLDTPYPGRGSGETITIGSNNYQVDTKSPIDPYSINVHPLSPSLPQLTWVRAPQRVTGPGGPSVTIGRVQTAPGSVYTVPPKETSPSDNSNPLILVIDSNPVGLSAGQILWIHTDPSHPDAYRVISVQGGGGPALGPNVILAVNLTDTPGNKIPATANDIAYLRLIPELPPGRMGTYGMGRSWQSGTDGRSYIAGDLVGGSSGDPSIQSRDAVLKVTENALLANGGAFVVPGIVGEIRAMRFVSILDASLGQGPLAVLTPDVVFSCNAPVDRTEWSKVTNPIQTESLISNGGLSQNSTINANGDLMFRAKDGIRSLILARREFATWGNVPISREVDPTLRRDNQELLGFSSAIVFDNRLLMTALPSNGSNGVQHQGIIALNFDPVSTLRGKLPSIYDGVWGGAQILQLITGPFSGRQRAFAIISENGQIKLMEILTDDQSTPDFAVELPDTGPTYIFETPVLFRKLKNKDENDFIRLDDGEVYVDQIEDGTRIDVYFRPDYDTNWHAWNSIYPPIPYQPRIGLGKPPMDSDPNTGRPNCEGYAFQFRFNVTGRCRIMGARFYAVDLPDPKFAPLRGQRFVSISTSAATPTQSQAAPKIPPPPPPPFKPPIIGSPQQAAPAQQVNTDQTQS